MVALIPITIESAWRMGAAFLLETNESAFLVAQVLLADVLAKDRVYLHTYPEAVLSCKEKEQYDSLLLRYKNGEPLAYIREVTEFYSLTFQVNEAVLIPRPETEVLVDEAISVLRSLEGQPAVLDMGTGSGAIAISLAVIVPTAAITAVDNSRAALVVAHQNAKRHDCSHIMFIESHWFNDLPAQTFDCIVSNPPYLTVAEWQASGNLHREPQQALIGGDDGLCAYREIANSARTYLKENGVLILEHGYLQAEAVRDILYQAGYREVFSVRDLSQHERITRATR